MSMNDGDKWEARRRNGKICGKYEERLTSKERRWREKEVGANREENSAFELFKVNSFHLCIDPQQKVCTFSKHP